MDLDLIEIVRFLSKIQKIDNCWVWFGSRTYVGGYGQIRLKGKLYLVHRLSYELFKGEIPRDMTIDHLCQNPPCVNPNHLEVVTMKENLMRSTINLCYLNTKKTHCINGHELHNDNLCTYELNQLRTRKCKLCTRNNDKKYARSHYTH